MLPEFDANVFLDSPDLPEGVAVYRSGETIYEQGDPSDAVLYIQTGSVKLEVVSSDGREAVVGLLHSGAFLGDEALAGQSSRRATATAITACRLRIVPKGEMIRLLHQEHVLSDRFIAHVLARNRHLEEDLVDQLFNASEKRLARALLLMARYGTRHEPRRVVPAVSQQALAKMVGTTRSRVNVFMNKFRKLGFIDYDNDSLTVHPTLLTVLVRDSPSESGRPSRTASASRALR